jgi:protein TonB
MDPVEAPSEPTASAGTIRSGAASAAATPGRSDPDAPAPDTPSARAAPTADLPGPLASAAPRSDVNRGRVGPRVDASWAGNAAPAYPSTARRLGMQGEVRLDVHVGTSGTVLDVRLRTSSGSAALDRSAIDAVRHWRFTPARIDGEAVAEWYRDWKWVFRLEG